MGLKEINANPREVDQLRDLLVAAERAKRDVQLAFIMFARAHDLPDEARLASVGPGVVTVEVPE